ncbi:MAG: hypothetical protein ACLRFH_01535 [Opitutales bacterium]
MKMEKRLPRQSFRHNKRSNTFRGNLTFTVLCLIALGSGIAALSLKNYQYKRYWQRTQHNYVDEKQALELCFVAFKQLKEAVSRDTVITYESAGKLRFVDTITQEDVVDFDKFTFEDSIKISIFSNPNAKHHIPCLSQAEGMKQTLEELFQQEIRPEPLKEEVPFKDNYKTIRDRWFSLKNNTSLEAKLFDSYLKAWTKSGTQLNLTFLNPFDRFLNGNYNLQVIIEATSGSIEKSSEFNCSLNPGVSVSHAIEIEKSFLRFNLTYGKVLVEKTLRAATSTKPASETKWKKAAKPSPPATEAVRSVEIVDNVYFKTQTPLQCLNACLFFHKNLEPAIAFGKKDAINEYFWNKVVFDKSAVFFNLNANEVQLRQQLDGLFEESVAERLCEDICGKQPFYDVYSFASGLSQDLASHWNALDNPPIFVLREESFIIESQLKNFQKNTSVHCRLWVHREAKSDREREWIIDQIEYKRF